MLEETHMLRTKLVDALIDPSVELVLGQRSLANPRKYRRFVGKLNYLSHYTRHLISR